MLNLESNATDRAAVPPTIAEWLSAQRLESMVAQRTQELERTIEQLLARQAELESQANHDCLTGLASRRLLGDRFECAAARAKRGGNAFGLFVVDLDGFKAINDTHGHWAGDTVLVEVARRLSSALRSCDTVARLGGDEFAVIVDCMREPALALQVSEKMRSEVAQEIYLKSGVCVSVGASIGHAIYLRDGVSLEQLLAAADRAMYAEKHTLNTARDRAANVSSFASFSAASM